MATRSSTKQKHGALVAELGACPRHFLVVSIVADGVVSLFTQDHQTVQMPEALLPWELGAGNIVSMEVRHAPEREERRKKDALRLQERIVDYLTRKVRPRSRHSRASGESNHSQDGRRSKRSKGAGARSVPSSTASQASTGSHESRRRSSRKELVATASPSPSPSPEPARRLPKNRHEAAAQEAPAPRQRLPTPPCSEAAPRRPLSPSHTEEKAERMSQLKAEGLRQLRLSSAMGSDMQKQLQEAVPSFASNAPSPSASPSASPASSPKPSQASPEVPVVEPSLDAGGSGFEDAAEPPPVPGLEEKHAEPPPEPPPEIVATTDKVAMECSIATPEGAGPGRAVMSIATPEAEPAADPELDLDVDFLPAAHDISSPTGSGGPETSERSAGDAFFAPTYNVSAIEEEPEEESSMTCKTPGCIRPPGHEGECMDGELRRLRQDGSTLSSNGGSPLHVPAPEAEVHDFSPREVCTDDSQSL